MAVNAYLVIDGRPGPSTSKKDAIDVLSFAFGGQQTSTAGPGSSGSETRAGRADIKNLKIMKVLDKTSPLLWDDMTTGNILTKATLYYDKPMGDNQEDYFRIELEEVLITRIDHAGASENPTEAVSLAFSKAKFCYNPEDGNGKLAGWVEKGYDLHTLKPY
jgi:type VI secretion system secreted protein Hcp